jgi:hypothetical protein
VCYFQPVPLQIRAVAGAAALLAATVVGRRLCEWKLRSVKRALAYDGETNWADMDEAVAPEPTELCVALRVEALALALGEGDATRRGRRPTSPLASRMAATSSSTSRWSAFS